MSFTTFPADADFDGHVLLDEVQTTIVSVGQITNATSLREQGEVVHDPNDPNLGTNPEREYKFYFTAIVSGTSTTYVCFSADGVTWGSPVAVTIPGGLEHEDPAVVTLLNTRGQVHRDGSSRMHLYLEEEVSHAIYGFYSVDGLTWTALAGNPVLDRGSAGQFDAHLAGSPVPRHDGTNYIIGYEGIDGPTDGTQTEAFGIAYGADPAVLTKSANNPVWVPDDDPFVNKSIVVDSFFKNDAGDAIYFLVHDGIANGTPRMWRAKTAVTDPLAWTRGDIETLGGNASTIQTDMTLDHSAGLGRAIAAPENPGQSLASWSLIGRGAYVPDRMKTKTSGAFTTWPLHRKAAGAFNRFLPSDLADLGMWLRASSLGLANNDPVASWTDLSGNSRTPTQATGANQPTYIAQGVNGRPVVRFDGGDNLALPTGLDLTRNRPGLTVFAVASTAAVNSGNWFVFFASAASAGSLRAGLYRNASTYNAGGRRLDADGFQAVQSPNTVTVGPFEVLTAQFDYTNSDLYLRRNSVDAASSTTFQTAGSSSDTNSGAVVIGANNAGTEAWNGDIAELIVYRRSLTPTELADVESYLSRRYDT